MKFLTVIFQIQNTDLSNMNISKIFHVENCCFVNCHISGDIYDMRHVDIDNSNFSYNDLYGTISVEDFIDTFCDDNWCSFSGNRINIIYNRDDFNKSQLIKLGKIIKKGMISHCCVNGKEIKSFTERQEIASQMMNKYNAAVDSIKEDIIKQLTKAKE